MFLADKRYNYRDKEREWVRKKNHQLFFKKTYGVTFLKIQKEVVERKNRPWKQWFKRMFEQKNKNTTNVRI